MTTTPMESPRLAAASEQAVSPGGIAPHRELLQGLGQKIVARGAVHSGGLVGGVGLKARDLSQLAGALQADEEGVLAVVRERLQEALEAARITYGVDAEKVAAAAREFLEHIRRGDAAPVARRVAAGDAPEAGEDGRVEYVLNHRGRAFAELAGLEERSTRTQAHVVNAGDALARLVPPRAPAAGTAVTGEEIVVDTVPEAASLDGVAGDNTKVEGSTVMAVCDGLCVEDASGWLRVIPEIVLDHVDAASGRVPESGISASNVAVRRSLKGEYGVATTENLFVGEGSAGGSIDGLAPVQARNVVVNGPLSGASEREAPVEASEACVAREVLSRQVTARQVLIAGDSHLGRIEADAAVRIDGGVRGGILSCPGEIVVCGDLGTEQGGSSTVIRFSGGSAQARRERRQAAARQRLQQEREEVQAQIDALAVDSDNRAKADAYWAQMAAGEAPPPKGVMQAKAHQIFTEQSEKRQRAERRAASLARALQQLTAGSEEEGDEQGTATLTVAGTVYLDVIFELGCELSPDDAEIEVDFTHDGQRFRNHKLADVKRLLNEKVNTYLEQKNAAVEERKAAIDKMFEGQQSKPSAPEVEAQTFEIDLRWAHVDTDDALAAGATACVSSSDPQTVRVVNRARLREPMQGVVVTVHVEGARALFAITQLEDTPKKWVSDPEVEGQLDGICVAGLNASQMIRGEGSFIARPSLEEEEPR